MERTGPERSPRHEMEAEVVIGLLDALEAAGVTAWLDGGWAVDAVLGEQGRPHDDLDLVVEITRVEPLLEALAERGFELARGASPTSFELVDVLGRQVDVHPVAFAENGDGLYVMESGEVWRYPAEGFTGAGLIRGRRVRCLTPEAQVLCHSGYAPHRASYDDVHALCGRFGIALPEEYGRPRESYPVR